MTVNNENKYLTLIGHHDIQLGIEQLKPRREDWKRAVHFLN